MNAKISGRRFIFVSDIDSLQGLGLTLDERQEIFTQLTDVSTIVHTTRFIFILRL